MKAASENLVPVTLELGGKSPTIVAKGRVQDRTVSAIVWGKLLSGGQTCIARTTPWCMNPRSTPSSKATTGW